MHVEGSPPLKSRSIRGRRIHTGGRLIPCTTMSSGSAPAGRASKCGDNTCRTPATSPVAGSIFNGTAYTGDHATIMDMTTANAPYVERDLAHVWHPCTQMKDHEQLPPIPIRSRPGAWLEDFDGRRYLDCISSWCVNLFGHCNARINAAVRTQLDKLEHVILAGFTHEPVIELSEALVKVLPAGLTHCFYADNGSSAVEVAVKMSFHYLAQHRPPRQAAFHHAVQQLSRRDTGCTRGRQCRALQGDL